MVSLNNQMSITNFGLTRVAEELIAEREFNRSLVTIVGSPAISGNGIMRAIGKNEGALHEGLEFTNEDTIEINFEGTIGDPSIQTQCLWSLFQEEGRYCSLSINDGNLMFRCAWGGSQHLIFSENVESFLTEDESIQVSVKFSKQKYSYDYIIGSHVGNDEGIVPSSSIWNNVNFTKLTKVIIGNGDTFENVNPATLRVSWTGDVKLARFKIFKNESLYYTPSDDIYFIFSKVALCDGTNPLSDDSIPVNNRTYFFPIKEVARSGNHVLIKTTVDKEAYLTIREIGLYITVEGKEKLFSIIKGLSIQKTSDIGYDLIFHVNIDISIVNVNAFPEVVLADVKNVSKSDFIEIKEYTLGMVADMEVAVGKNATEIGYNKAQVFYRYSDALNLSKESWLTSDGYNKLCNNIKIGITRTFNPELMNIHEAQVTPEGIATFTGTGTLESPYISADITIG